jgi:hypothetical protein
MNVSGETAERKEEWCGVGRERQSRRMTVAKNRMTYCVDEAALLIPRSVIGLKILKF